MERSHSEWRDEDVGSKLNLKSCEEVHRGRLITGRSLVQLPG